MKFIKFHIKYEPWIYRKLLCAHLENLEQPGRQLTIWLISRIISSCARNQVSIKVHRRNLLNQRLPFSRPAVSRWWFVGFPRRTGDDGSPRRDLYSGRDVALGRSITVGPWHHEEIAWDLSRALIPQPRNMFGILVGRSRGLTVRTDEWLIEMSRRHDCADVDSLWFTTTPPADD